MAVNNTEKRLAQNNPNPPAEQQNMEQMYYRPNEASFNYNGVTLNINLPTFVKTIKKIIDNSKKNKALKELKKLEQKTMTDVQHHNGGVFEEIIDEIEED